MKTSQFSAEQIIKILEQAERGEQTIGTICREHGITETTFYRWRKTFGDMTVPDTQRLRELEKEWSAPIFWSI
jgi:putative transposase